MFPDTDIEVVMRHRCRVCGGAVFGGDWQEASDWVHRARRVLALTDPIGQLLAELVPACPAHWEVV